MASQPPPIDLSRFGHALFDIERTLDLWGMLPARIAAVLATYEIMSAAQKSEVTPKLEELRVRLERLGNTQIKSGVRRR